MPISEQSAVSLRCPVCLAREIDVVLYREGDEYYCVKCGYTGDEAATRSAYEPIRAKFKWVLRRIVQA